MTDLTTGFVQSSARFLPGGTAIALSTEAVLAMGRGDGTAMALATEAALAMGRGDGTAMALATEAALAMG